MNKYAVVLSINDSYCFLAANLLFSLHENSIETFKQIDVIIYSNDLQEKNKEVLKKIKKEIHFKEISNPFAEQLCNHPHVKKWGCYILQKLHIFELLQTERYKKIVFLDVDMYVAQNINELFENDDYDIAFRANSWSGLDVYPHLKDERKPNVPMFNGGVVVFNSSLNRFGINVQKINDRARELLGNNTSLGRGGIEEILLSYMCYYYEMRYKKLPSKFNLAVDDQNVCKAAIVHFSGPGNRKPWKNGIVYRAFPKWFCNYKKFIEFGGENYALINESEGYFNDLYTFNTLKFLEKYEFILNKHANEIYEEGLIFNWDFHSNSCIFHINKLPKSVFIEVFKTPRDGFMVSLKILSRLSLETIGKDGIERIITIIESLLDKIEIEQNKDALSISTYGLKEAEITIRIKLMMQIISPILRKCLSSEKT